MPDQTIPPEIGKLAPGLIGSLGALLWMREANGVLNRLIGKRARKCWVSQMRGALTLAACALW